jgi:putative ABC transport system permease protein
MSTWTQVREITLMNLRSIPERLGPSLVIVVGIAGVVGVLVALLSMSSGLDETLGSGGRTDQVVITRGGSNGELASFLAIGSATLIKQDPGIARAEDGTPLASSELIVITEVPRPGQRTGANVTLRGVEPVGLALRDGFRIVRGRLFRPGVQELIVVPAPRRSSAASRWGARCASAARRGPSSATSRAAGSTTANCGATSAPCRAPGGAAASRRSSRSSRRRRCCQR